MSKAFLKWRSRRGMLELDLLLSSFSQFQYSRLESVQRKNYLSLLEQEDQVLWNWFFVNKKYPNHFKEIIFEILEFYRLKHKKHFVE